MNQKNVNYFPFFIHLPAFETLIFITFFPFTIFKVICSGFNDSLKIDYGIF